MNPTTYRPTHPDQFIGPARKVARLVDHTVRSALPTGDPIKLLFNGPPGTGKSSLAAFAAGLLGCGKWSVTKLNGTDVKIEIVADLARSLAYKDLFSGWRLILIEEADKIPTVAQVRFLTLLDDLPPYAAVVCTSNCEVDSFEARFQSRFQVLNVQGPTEAELRELIRPFFGTLSVPLTKLEPLINQISTFACGNVRQAILDTKTAIGTELLAA